MSDITRAKVGLFDTVELKDLIGLLQTPDPALPVRFDFGSFYPTVFASYRGRYDHLALGYSEDYTHYGGMSVGALLKLCREQIGKKYDGWKGGTFTMGLKTPVWVANQGDATCVGIVGIKASYYAFLITEHLDL